MSESSRNIQVFGKPIEKLIEVVSKGIGITYKPKAIRNEAEAKAYEIEKIAEAEAKASIIRYEAENEIAERAKQRLYHQEIQRQVNIDNIVNEASLHLNDEVSEKSIDEDWRTRFFVKAQDISSTEMQEVWGKILAGEINSPGQFSVRALDILANLSKEEAKAFKQLSGLVIDNIFLIKINNDLGDFDIQYGMKLVLTSAGILFHDQQNLTVNLNPLNNDTGDFSFGGRRYKVEATLKKYIFSCYALTLEASTLLQVIDVEPNFQYLESLIDYHTKKGFIFTEIKPVD